MPPDHATTQRRARSASIRSSAITTPAATAAPARPAGVAPSERSGYPPEPPAAGRRSSRRAATTPPNPATARPPRPRRSPGPASAAGATPFQTTRLRVERPTAAGHAQRAIRTTPVVAFGDVHGCAALLERELEQHYGSGAELIFLRDLIDRAPEPRGDRKVLERIWALQQQPELWGLTAVTVLRGNHEQMLLDALSEQEPAEATEAWIWNGGDPQLLPVVRQHRDWFEALPRTAIRGRCLFVHAGVRPGVPLAQQTPDDLLWIRHPFLSQPHGLPYTVVHGHSITRGHAIERHPHRINLDSGAFCSGVLSSLRLDPLDPTKA